MSGASQDEQDQHINLIRSEIARLDPDILILQEVASLSVLQETLEPLGDDWQIAIVSRFRSGNFISGQQLAIAARFQAESAWAEEWKNGWAGPPRGYATATFNFNGKHLAVYNLHLKSNLGVAEENISKREDAITQLIEHLNTPADRIIQPDYVIIGGDFNTDHPDAPEALSPGEKTFLSLEKNDFHWSFSGIPHRDRITCPAKGSYPDASFDHIWTKNLNKPLAEVAKASGSDHLPVVIDLIIPAN